MGMAGDDLRPMDCMAWAAHSHDKIPAVVCNRYPRSGTALGVSLPNDLGGE